MNSENPGLKITENYYLVKNEKTNQQTVPPTDNLQRGVFCIHIYIYIYIAEFFKIHTSK